MKRKMAFLSALVLAAVSVPFSVSAEGYVQGDVDMDGMITGHDAAIVSKYADGVLKMDITEEQLLLADMNGDGAVDASDAAAIYEQQVYPLGDVDLDGTLYLDDASVVIHMYLYTQEEFESVHGETSPILADVDCNGIIDSDDANTILSSYAKFGAGFPYFEEGKYYFIHQLTDWYDFDGNDEFTLDDVTALIEAYAMEACGKGNARAIIMNNGDTPDPNVNHDYDVDLDDVMITLTAYAEAAAGLR